MHSSSLTLESRDDSTREQASRSIDLEKKMTRNLSTKPTAYRRFAIFNPVNPKRVAITVQKASA